MANYLTTEYLLTVFARQDLIDLTDVEGVGEIDETVLGAAIAQAEGEFHSYVARRYQVPINLDTEKPELAETIRDKLVALLVHKLWSPPRKPSVPQSVRDAYRDAIAWLRDVVQNKVTLGATPAPAASGQSPTQVDYGTEERRVGRDKLRGL